MIKDKQRSLQLAIRSLDAIFNDEQLLRERYTGFEILTVAHLPFAT
jgi:hypothetical protein